MSIINDALKKTQLKLKKKDALPDQTEPKTAPDKNPENINIYEKLYNNRDKQSSGSPAKSQKKETVTRRGAKKWFKALFAILICLLCAGGGLLLFKYYPPLQSLWISVKNISPPRQSPAPALATVKKRKFKDGELILNGTSLIDGKRVALINDEIYEIGEIVGGKKITDINLTMVELRDNEKIITLKVR